MKSYRTIRTKDGIGKLKHHRISDKEYNSPV